MTQHKSPSPRAQGNGSVEIRLDLFTFLFVCLFTHMVKIVCCSGLCLIFLKFNICYRIASISRINTKFTTPRKTADKGGSAERHREFRWTHLLSCFKETLSNTLVSIYLHSLWCYWTDLRRRSSCCKGQQPRHRWAGTPRTPWSTGQDSLQPNRQKYKINF